MKRSALMTKAAQAIEQFDMLRDCKCIAVGLSGGADSTALLDCMCALAPGYGVQVRAVHVNHCIRGEQADADQLFAQKLCEKLGVEIDCFTVDVPARAAAEGLGLEECGRICRYECFQKVSALYRCKVATAHTLSDSAETVLFNMTRGCGIAGMCGIPPVRSDSLTVIRPLILCTREEVEEYCREQGLDFVTDASNADTAYSRNRIRLDVVPALRQINPAFHQSAARLMTCAAQDEAYLMQAAIDAAENARVGNGWEAAKLTALPPSLSQRAIMHIITESSGIMPQYRHIALALDYLKAGNGAVEIAAGCRFCVRDAIASVDCGALPEPQPCLWEYRVSDIFSAQSAQEDAKSGQNNEKSENKAEINLPDGRIVHLCVMEVVHYDESQKNGKLLFKNCIDYDIINDNTFLRFRRDGDRYKPFGSAHTKRLKKLLCDSGVPREQRDSLLMVACDRQLLWLEGFGVSQEAAVDKQTRRVLQICLDRLECEECESERSAMQKTQAALSMEVV